MFLHHHILWLPTASHDCWAILILQNSRQYFKSPINVNLQTKDRSEFTLLYTLVLAVTLYIYLHITVRAILEIWVKVHDPK